jgi:hypothetical protein
MNFEQTKSQKSVQLNCGYELKLRWNSFVKKFNFMSDKSRCWMFYYEESLSSNDKSLNIKWLYTVNNDHLRKHFVARHTNENCVRGISTTLTNTEPCAVIYTRNYCYKERLLVIFQSEYLLRVAQPFLFFFKNS